MSEISARVSNVLTTYTKSIILVILLFTVAIGVGVTQVEQESDTEQFETESPAAEAQEYIGANFTADTEGSVAPVQIIQRGDNVLTQEALLESLALQQDIRDNEKINETLITNSNQPSITGFANAIAAAAINQEQPAFGASLETQRDVIDELEDDELEDIVTLVLDEEDRFDALSFMPSSYTPGSSNATAGLTIVSQELENDVQDPDAFPDDLTEAQLEIRELTQDRDSEYSLFGFGILNDEIENSLADSGAIVGPLALLFVVVALTIAYRDILDITLGVFGILLVLVWTFGFMGWAGIDFNQLLLSVPVLLIGLSIDYAIHVFMRYREQREADESADNLRRPMAVALAGVGAALVWVTATAALGFLANLTSPVGPLQDFGIVSAFGVFAALIVFGVLTPALKIELDGALEARGINRQKQAFGTGGSAFSRVLQIGVTTARRVPLAVVVLALILSAGGLYGATQVDTSFDETDFLADSPPDWTENLPGPMAPGTYQASDDLDFIGENFQQDDNEAEILIRGNVTDDQTLRWLNTASTDARELDTVFVGADGSPDITSPLSLMEEAAAQGSDNADIPETERDEAENNYVEFWNLYEQSVDNAGVPEENVTALYNRLLVANPQAAEYIYNDGDEYQAVRLQFGVVGDAGIGAIADDNREIASNLEDESDGVLTASAAGDQVIFDNVQEDLLDTVIQGLVITLVSVFVFLAIAYRLTGSPASLGIVTMIPVALAVTWILGSMWVLDIPFNTLTGTITSLTVGLGIAYSIHISSRYELELRRQGDIWNALETTVTGTGGALLGSAATTVGGFGTLVFAILPILRQFGIVTGLTIIYAFFASVLVLPALLVLWTQYIGFSADDSSSSDLSRDDDSSGPGSPTDAPTPATTQNQDQEARSSPVEGDAQSTAGTGSTRPKTALAQYSTTQDDPQAKSVSPNTSSIENHVQERSEAPSNVNSAKPDATSENSPPFNQTADSLHHQADVVIIEEPDPNVAVDPSEATDPGTTSSAEDADSVPNRDHDDVTVIRDSTANNQ